MKMASVTSARNSSQRSSRPSYCHMHEHGDHQPRLGTGDGQGRQHLVPTQIHAGDRHGQGGQDQQRQPDADQFCVAY